MKVNDQLKDRFKHVANLPTLPQVASHLLKIINDPLTSSHEVAFVIGQDLSLSAKVLRLANSAFYGIPRSITSINTAVVILGLKVINTMVLTLIVFDMFPEPRKVSSLFDRKAFWLHSLSCGLIAKHLAARLKKFTMFDPEEAFCAGLLHDIGKVVMEQYMHEQFHSALKIAYEKKISLYEAEKSVLGFTHTEVAEWLTSTWSLPQEIQLPLIYHHSVSKSSQCHDVISLCHYADWLCYDTGMGLDKAYCPPRLQQEYTDHLQISPDVIEDIKKQLPEEIEKTSILFEIAKS